MLKSENQKVEDPVSVWSSLNVSETPVETWLAQFVNSCNVSHGEWEQKAQEHR